MSSLKSRHRVMEYAVSRIFITFSRYVPRIIVYILVRGMAVNLFLLSFRRRRIALANISLALPELGTCRRWMLALRSFLNIADTTAESLMILTGRIPPAKFDDMIACADWQHLTTLEESETHGLLIITAHIGNWELMAHSVGRRMKKPTHVVARETSNPLLEKHFVKPLRTRFGSNVIYKKNALRHIVKALKKGEHVGMLIDQKSGRSIGIATPFFNHPVRATPTPALIQARYNITVLPMFLIRTAAGKYELKMGDVIRRTKTGPVRDDEIAELTEKHQHAVEQMVKDHPEQWLWMHDRWRLRPHKR